MERARIAMGLAPIILMLLIFMQPFLSDTLISRVTIGNAAPQVTNVHLDEASDPTPDETITLAAHEYYNRIWCNFTVTDNNGQADIRVPKANLTRLGTSQYASDNTDNHYSNTSCIYNVSGGGNSLEFQCLFRVRYWADNGTWFCNVSVNDTSMQANGQNNSESDTATIVGTIGLKLNQTTFLSYGTLAAGQDSSAPSMTTIINTGNWELDIDLNGTDMTNASNTILAENQSYNYSAAPTTTSEYPGAWDGTGSSRLTFAQASLTDFTLADKDDAQASDPFWYQNKTISWKIRIPSGQAAGVYDGSVQIDGVADDGS